MLASINPLGERMRNRRWGPTFSWYLAGSLLGGAAIGMTLGLFGAGFETIVPITRTATAVIVVALGTVALAYEAHLVGLQVPTIHRQVNEDWLARYRAWVYAGGFGFQLALGVVTIVTSATVYLTWALAFLSGSALGGLAIGVTFGIVRALPLLLVAEVESPAALRTRLRAFNAFAPVARRLALTTLVSVPLLGAIAVGVGT
jgi:sulfite exporter TauE/SafE